MKTLSVIALITIPSLTCYSQIKRIVFVCEHGAAKSVIAATYFNKLANERKLPWEAICRGTNPDSTLTSATKKGLEADKLLNPDLKPEKLIMLDTSNVKKIILFTPLPKNFSSDIQTEDWSTLPNIEAGYSERRDALIKQITILLDSLEKH